MANALTEAFFSASSFSTVRWVLDERLAHQGHFGQEFVHAAFNHLGDDIGRLAGFGGLSGVDLALLFQDVGGNLILDTQIGLEAAMCMATSCPLALRRRNRRSRRSWRRAGRWRSRLRSGSERSDGWSCSRPTWRWRPCGCLQRTDRRFPRRTALPRRPGWLRPQPWRRRRPGPGRSALATKSVSQFTSTRAPTPPSTKEPMMPSAATRPAILEALLPDLMRRISSALAASPSASTRAFLHSIMPRPVAARRSETILR